MFIPVPTREEKCPVWAQVEIVINNPQIIDLFSCKFYVGPHKGRFGIVYYNPRRSLCPLVPKQYTFSATKGSPQIINMERRDVISIILFLCPI